MGSCYRSRCSAGCGGERQRTKNCYTYDLITDSIMLSNGNNSYPQNIIYDDIEYLYKNIYNEDGTIAFWRKGYPRIYDNEKSIIMYNADIGYSKYYSSDDTLENKFEIPQQMVYNYDQIMLFANGYNVSEFLVNDQVWLENHIKIHDNDIFIANMPKLILYQTIEDLTLYSNMTIELLDNFNNSINRKCSYHHKYRKNVDIVHCPISLKYMAIFVNNIYMDENHVEILSDRRFMLKNLDDYPEIETKKMSELYPNDETDEIGYVINSIDIYCYPFTFDSMYSDYYEDKITYKDEYRNREYNEYPIKDLLYDKFMSELVSQSKKHCCNIIFEGDDIKDPQEYYLSDFRHYALSKFTHGELSRMKHDRLTDDGILSNYTHDELSKYTHNELSYFIYDNE